MTDTDLIKKVKEEQDSSALTELVNRHTGLYVKILDTYSYVPPVDKQDMLEDKMHNIYQYALNYDPDKNMKFSVYLGQRLKWDCISAINKSVDMEEVNPNNVVEERNIPDEETIRFIIDNTSEITDKRFFQIFRLRHLVEKSWSWKKIGRAIGMTYEGARKVYLHNIEFLRNRIKKEYLVTA